MGQEKSIKGFGEAKISVERPNQSYNAGEVMKGCVSVDVIKQVQTDSIEVSFAGAIQTNCANDDELASETAPLASLTVTVATFPNGLCEIGNYQFPFEFLIPSNLPSSCASIGKYHGPWHGSHGWAVEYNVEMLCGRQGVTKKTLVSTLPINLYQIPSQQDSSRSKVESVVPLTSGCCCTSKAGDVSVAGSLNKTSYAWKEPILVQGGVINGSSKTVQKIEATLFQNIAWNAQQYNRRMHARTHVKIQKMVFSTPPVATNSGVGRSLFDGNTSGELPLQVQLNVLERCAETLSYPTLTVSYVVELRCIISGMSKSPTIKIPLNVVAIHGGPPQSSGVQSVQPHPQQKTKRKKNKPQQQQTSVSQGSKKNMNPPPPTLVYYDDANSNAAWGLDP